MSSTPYWQKRGADADVGVWYGFPSDSPTLTELLCKGWICQNLQTPTPPIDFSWSKMDGNLWNITLPICIKKQNSVGTLDVNEEGFSLKSSPISSSSARNKHLSFIFNGKDEKSLARGKKATCLVVNRISLIQRYWANKSCFCCK